MNRQRWEKVDALADAALDLPRADRRAWLEQQTGGDSGLVTAVLRIIEAGERTTGLLDAHALQLASPLLAHGAGPAEAAAAPALPERIGPYRIVRELGYGGMGTVYLAERDDGEFRLRVALKLVRRGLHHDPRILRRFREERQILASLQHPDIARLLDGGITDDGVPWFVMEYVEGEPIDRFCDLHGYPVRQRLALFARVCDAVAYAHRQNIVHRDIKPSNVLVMPPSERDLQAAPRLLDFGVAKLIADTDRETLLTNLTRTGERLLTPEYASPEQVRGEPVRPASDVYALGILLYELLTGVRPFLREGRTPHEVERAILEEEPFLPSTAVTRATAARGPASRSQPSPEQLSAARGSTPSRLRQDLRGDLDAIVMQTLRKEPERRYPTAAELAEDVRRHLHGQAVSARGSAGFRYRAGKLVRRHRAVLATAALALLAASAGVLALAGGGEERLVAGATQRVAFDAALELDPALSPDGRRVAYATDVGGVPRIYVAEVATGRAVPLTDSLPSNQRAPRWSPDGDEIAFQAAGGIYTVPATGGQARLRLGMGWGPADRWAAYPAWSPDGRQLAYVQDRTLFVRLLDGGQPRVLETGLREPHSPAWSPDGRWIAVVDGNSTFSFGADGGPAMNHLGNAAPSSLWVVPVQGGPPVRLTSDDALNTSPAWLPRGRTLLFVSSRGGDRDVYRLDVGSDGRPAGEPARLTAGLGAHSIAVSADGARLATAVFRNISNIWSAPLPTDAGSETTGEIQQVTRGTQSIEGLAVSRDGQWLAFDSDRRGNQDIYKLPVAGGQPIRLTTSTADDFMPHWSPDGRELAFYSFLPDGTRRVKVIGADGGRPQDVVASPGDQRFPSWSPDGQTLVFESDQRGPRYLHLVSRDASGRWGQARQLTPGRGASARWSPDGSLIAYTSEDGIHTIAADGSRERLVLSIPDMRERLGNLEWSADGREIIYKWFDPDGRTSFRAVPAAGGEPRLLLQLDSAHASRRFEFATDGRSLYFTVTQRESDVLVLELTVQK